MKINYKNAELTITAGLISQFPKMPLPAFAFSGRSNVGKSSLINTLLERKKLARVSSAPGKTITINFYRIDQKLYFVDLPGYGFAKRSADEQKKWSLLVDSFFTSEHAQNESLTVIQLIDLKVGPTGDDITMLNYLEDTETPYFIVATKADKLNKTDRTAMLEALSAHPSIAKGTPVIPFSSLSGEGRDAVIKEIDSRMKK